MNSTLLKLYDKVDDNKLYLSKNDREIIAKLCNKQIRPLLMLNGENLDFALKMYCEEKFTTAYNINSQMDFVRMLCNCDLTLKQEIFGFICDNKVVNCKEFTVASRKKLVNLLIRCKNEDVNLTIIEMAKFLAGKNIYGIFRLCNIVLNTQDKETAILSFDLLTELLSEGYEERAFDIYGEEYKKYYCQDALSFIRCIVSCKYTENIKLCSNIILKSDFPVSVRLQLASCASKIDTRRILVLERLINTFSNEIKNNIAFPFALVKISNVGNMTFTEIEKSLFCNQLNLEKLLMLLSNENDLDNYKFKDDNLNNNVPKKVYNTSDKLHL